MPIRSDASEWPLVIDTVWGESDVDSVKAYIETHNSYLAREERYVTLLDGSGGEMLSARDRRLISGWIREKRATMATYRAGVAFVVPSALVRGMLTAIYWITSPPYPYRVVSDVESARAWCAERLAEG